MAQNSPDASLDAEIELKKRSRRRLVGATALALLAAVVLPMVMDHEPKPVGQDVQVRIPGQEAGGFASRILPTKPAATPLPAAESKPVVAPAPEAKSEPAKPEPAKTEPLKAVAEAGKPVVAKIEPPKAAPPKAEKAVETTKAPEAPKGAEKADAAKSEDARAAAALAGNEHEQWVVQLGAYKEAANVKTLIAKLKQLNVPTYTESFASPNGARTRVRAGPFSTREAAEKARTRIKIIGIDGPVAQK